MGCAMLFFPPRCPILISSSKLNGIEERLRLLCDESEPREHTERARNCENAFQLLDDLQEAIFHYQVCSQPNTLLDVNENDRWRNGEILMIRDLKRW